MNKQSFSQRDPLVVPQFDNFGGRGRDKGWEALKSSEMAEQSLIGRSRLAGRDSWPRMRESVAMHLGYFDWAPVSR